MGISDLVGGLAKLATDELKSDIEFVYPFNCAPIDIILGGGIYGGRIYEIFGWESHGKSTFGLEAAKSFCDFYKARNDDNYAVLWIETESVFDKVRAKWLGCDIDRFLVAEAETVEDGFSIIETTIDKAEKAKMRVFIVWDTIAAAPTKNEKSQPGQWGGGMAEKPRLIRFALRKLTDRLGATNSTLIFVNQCYESIGGHQSSIPESPGGGGLRFHPSVRIFIAAKEQMKRILPSGEEFSEGIVSEIFTVKNKLTLPRQKCQVVIYGEKGIDKLDTVVRFLKRSKAIPVAGGGWCSIEFPDNVNGEIVKRPISFQSLPKLREIIKVQYPKLEEYLSYLVYLYFTNVSPLIKVKIIKKVWGYEKEFYGRQVTSITDKEFEIAEMIYEEVLRETQKEEESEAEKANT